MHNRIRRAPSARIIIAVALCLGVATADAGARDSAQGRKARLKAISERHSADAPPAIKPSSSFAYGNNPDQILDFWQATPGKNAPLIIFVHGGGWQHGSKDNATGTWKPAHYLNEGYNFASINYRLVPSAQVEDQAADVAAAVKALLDRADELGIDRRRVVLMGHSAGAHLVAVVGTDPRYLEAVGLSLTDIRGVIPIDGAAYDVPRQMQEGPQIMQSTYQTVFGGDVNRQKQLSPYYQAAAPNVAQFLILHVQRPDGIAQSNGLGDALKRAGAMVEMLSVPGKGLEGHAEINRRMGDPDYPATATVDQWLKRVFAG